MLTAGKKTVLNVSRVPDGTRLVVSESEWAAGPSASNSLETLEAPPGFEPGNEGFAVPCHTNLATVP